jgi:beta-glucosidase
MENIKVDIKILLKTMTLKEKIAQLLQLAPFFFKKNIIGEITGPMEELGINDEDIRNAGSVLGIGGAKEAIEIQKSYLENSEKKIPLIFMADIVHGYRTIFPIPLAIGCSFNEAIAEKAARVSAVESSVAGIHLTFSPMVDLVRDARWGRVMESTGEDPFLNSLFAAAFVRGYQGDDISKDENIAACVKHFAAYGAVEAGREYNTVDISERMLREYYMPAYKAALDQGCKTIMTSFNIVNSVPASANTWLMRDVLRNEWGFDGVVISDWGAVKELIPHGVAENKKEAAEKAIKAGVDIEMMTSCYVQHLEELLEEGNINIEIINEAVLRILRLKEELGLFENPYKGADVEKEAKLLLCDEHRSAARDVAAASMVLLKNENILPFNKNVKKIAIIGPFADSHEILGEWSWDGKFEETVSLMEGIVNKVGKNMVVISKGCDIVGGSDEEIKQAINIAKDVDVVILALGEHFNMSGEGESRASIVIPGRQEELANEIIKLGKPTAVVLFNGRPLEIKNLYNNAPAILEAWFPGTEGGNAIADILFGDKNPTARLCMCFPYAVGQIPIYYNAFNTGRPKLFDESDERYCTHYLDIPNDPLLPFGFGLSYSKFEYSDSALDSEVLTKDSSIYLRVKIKNAGSMAGEETVQLYIRDVSGSVVRPVKELKGLKKVHLETGEEREVLFEIKEEMLRFYNSSFEFKSENGKFIAMVGPNSRDVQVLNFELRME